jgi:hypothetical protein
MESAASAARNHPAADRADDGRSGFILVHCAEDAVDFGISSKLCPKRDGARVQCDLWRLLERV